MSVFIKITDKNQREHYLNTSYIRKFRYSNEKKCTILETVDDKMYITATPEEIIDMINLAKG